MASTRRPSTHETGHTSDASIRHDGHEDVETLLLSALGPLQDASGLVNVQLNPTTGAVSGTSPSKTDSSPPRPITSHSLTDFRFPPPVQPSFITDSPRKNASFYSAYSSSMQQMPELAPFHAFQVAPANDKENFYGPSAFEGLPHIPYDEPDYGFKGALKRPMVDSAAMRNGMNKKSKLEFEEPFTLPDPKDMPEVHDDGSKPNISYAELIGMAILRSTTRRLTLAQIYKWISDHFTFYKATESGWQNSIRHNLSLNKNFIKQERPKDDPGKGNYWAIKPGEERPFLLGKKTPVRRITNPDGSTYINADVGYRPAGTPAIGNFTLAPGPVKKTEPRVIDSAKFPDDADLSSDGTIPASDPALQDDDREELASMMPPPPTHIPSSPPADIADIASSPPAMALEERKATPPPVPRFPSTSRSGRRRQKFASLNDSGYWSSIESSAARGATHLLTSEADINRPRLKKGRAEEEIARIRSSSFDSPSKDLQPPLSSFASSSPLRDDNPLTPAVIFKRPAKPPPSISPNTNLRNHRDRMRALLGTPAKALEDSPANGGWTNSLQFGDEGLLGFTPARSPFKAARSPWKPFQDFRNTPNVHNSLHPQFDIFVDVPEEDIAARGSPEKRSARRPSLARAATSTSILADITGSARNNNIALAPPSNSPFSFSPFLAKPGMLRSPAKLGSPLKQSHNPAKSSPSTQWYDIANGSENVMPATQDTAELFGVNLPSDGSEEAIDIFQDFGKIGQAQHFIPANNRANGSPVRRTMLPPARPALGRSNTSRW